MVVHPKGGVVEGGVAGMEQSRAIAVALPPGLRVHGNELLGPVQVTVAISHRTWVGAANACGAAAPTNKITIKTGSVIALREFTGHYLLTGN
jgi:hypothetical protein